MRARGMPYNVKSLAEHHRVTPTPAVGPAFGSIMLSVSSPAVVVWSELPQFAVTP